MRQWTGPSVSCHVLAATRCTTCWASCQTSCLLGELSQSFGFSALDSLEILVLLSARLHFYVITETENLFFLSFCFTVSMGGILKNKFLEECIEAY